jgi:predicted aspartyl protease
MVKYDESFNPPAPVGEIVLQNISTGEKIGKIQVLLDTGADVSLLPIQAIENLNIEPSGEQVNLVGFDESQSFSNAYKLQIIFLGRRISGEFCAIDDEIGIIGRDVLNEFSLIFDGVNLEWKTQS